LLTGFAAVLILILISRQPEEDAAPLARALPYTLFMWAAGMGLLVLSLGTAWFAIVRQDALLSRSDNPRRSIDDRYVQRGAILDRHNRTITSSTGASGQMIRNYTYPDLSLTTGYSDPIYGQAGLEASQDNYLRGLQGSPALNIWWNRLLYGQPPPGLDMRISIDLDLQQVADSALMGHKSAAVLLNASTGEILVLSSRPSFDPNILAESWDALVASQDAPLLNRATQGIYPPGGAIAPIILGETMNNNDLPDLPRQLSYQQSDGSMLGCAIVPADTQSWGSILSSGCPAPLAGLGGRFLPVRLDNLFQSFYLSEAPVLPLPVTQPQIQPVINANLTSLGLQGLLVSPLQMALTASVISNQGSQPDPVLPLAVRTPQQGWVVIAESKSRSILSPATATRVSDLLAQPGKLFWEVVSVAHTGDTAVSWFVGGTIAQWEGAPMAVAILIEGDNPQLAQAVGEKLLQTALNSK
jgi:cell division protein FtsI/penicillin-binding protein 2